MFCNTEKAWLSQRGIAFTERNIAEDEAALSELEKLEVFSTPATLVDDQVVVGFNEKRLEELLGFPPAV
jgi:arsenate reductase-like glutaredoxin family protein